MWIAMQVRDLLVPQHDIIQKNIVAQGARDVQEECIVIGGSFRVSQSF